MNFERQGGLVPTAFRYEKVMVVGAGSIGSHVAEMLARYNFQDVTIVDFDIVNDHNVPGQFMAQSHIGRPKVEAVRDILISMGFVIPGWDFHCKDISTILGEEPYDDAKLVINAADSMSVRRQLVADDLFTMENKLLVDFRSGLEYGSILYASNTYNFGMTLDEYERSTYCVVDPIPSCGPRAMPSTCKTLVGLGIGHLVAVKAGRATLHKRINLDIGSAEIDFDLRAGVLGQPFAVSDELRTPSVRVETLQERAMVSDLVRELLTSQNE